MSMVGNYMHISQAELEHLIKNKNEVSEFIYPENTSKEYKNSELYIDKSWHLIHFLLTGSAWNGNETLRNLTIGGEKLCEPKFTPVGDSVRYLLPNQVLATYELVKNITSDELWSRFNAKAATDAYIYPIGFWSESSEEFIKEYVLDYFEKLKHFFKTGAEENQAILIWLT
ncbi:hypothetical protein CAL7716_041670 [Calothrix sp. PCC 7716]|nr:hypothetical protein CAL7716_041670 [Calothrix sp. PCC 7716]